MPETKLKQQAIADGSITASKLASGAVARGFLADVTPATFNTSSTSWVDLPGSDLTVVVGTRPIKLTYMAVLDEMPNGYRGWMRVYDVTGDAVVGKYVQCAAISANSSTATRVTIATPPQGTRTYRLQVRTESGTMRVLDAVFYIEEI